MTHLFIVGTLVSHVSGAVAKMMPEPAPAGASLVPSKVRVYPQGQHSEKVKIRL